MPGLVTVIPLPLGGQATIELVRAEGEAVLRGQADGVELTGEFELGDSEGGGVGSEEHASWGGKSEGQA